MRICYAVACIVAVLHRANAFLAAAPVQTRPSFATSYSGTNYLDTLRPPASTSPTTTSSYLDSLQRQVITKPATIDVPATIESDVPAEPPSIDRSKQSVLVLGWFYASSREFKLVERVYKRFGYTNIHIHESPVKQLSKPRGWYRTFVGSVTDDEQHANKLARHYDVVHCMSGGFLNLYLLLAAGVPLTFGTLILDSTPILPKPASFVRFTRAFLQDNVKGGKLFNRLVPRQLHCGAVTAKWTVGCMYVRLKHKLRVRKRLRAVSEDIAERGNQWTAEIARAAMHTDYGAVVEHAIKTIFKRAEPLKCIFLYNPEDPYISTDDIHEAARRAEEYGNTVTTVHVQTQHIQTLFRKPNALFEVLHRQ